MKKSVVNLLIESLNGCTLNIEAYESETTEDIENFIQGKEQIPID